MVSSMGTSEFSSARGLAESSKANRAVAFCPFFGVGGAGGVYHAAAPSAAELLIKACSEIVSELIRAHDDGRDVSLNAVRTKVAKKHRLKKSPRLVDIIAAVPEGPMKDRLLPKLKAKPIRTASGVR
jgi:hypothetical protein